MVECCLYEQQVNDAWLLDLQTGQRRWQLNLEICPDLPHRLLHLEYRGYKKVVP